MNAPPNADSLSCPASEPPLRADFDLEILVGAVNYNEWIYSQMFPYFIWGIETEHTNVLTSHWRGTSKANF